MSQIEHVMSVMGHEWDCNCNECCKLRSEYRHTRIPCGDLVVMPAGTKNPYHAMPSDVQKAMDYARTGHLKAGATGLPAGYEYWYAPCNGGAHDRTRDSGRGDGGAMSKTTQTEPTWMLFECGGGSRHASVAFDTAGEICDFAGCGCGTIVKSVSTTAERAIAANWFRRPLESHRVRP